MLKCMTDAPILTFDIPDELLEATDFGNAFAKKRLLQDCAQEWRLDRHDLSLEQVEGEWKIIVQGKSAQHLQEWMHPELMIALPEGVEIDASDPDQVSRLLLDCAVQMGVNASELMLVEDAETGAPCIVACGDSLRILLART